MTRPRKLPRLLAWLSPAFGLCLVVLVYRATYESEDGRYAGAEPALAGAAVAAPFFALFCAQAGCALAMSLSSSRRGQAAWAGGAALSAGVAVIGAALIL
ncbi:hypothetical protein [Nocardioides ferulae]|uniref:hypothetical protein n=1 Tax=Nocardioides ferulae TaxID=2340821 RepID=UPI000EAC18AF|nr:hypothetical protein [Nocardioides ferulae]